MRFSCINRTHSWGDRAAALVGAFFTLRVIRWASLWLLTCNFLLLPLHHLPLPQVVTLLAESCHKRLHFRDLFILVLSFVLPTADVAHLLMHMLLLWVKQRLHVTGIQLMMLLENERRLLVLYLILLERRSGVGPLQRQCIVICLRHIHMIARLLILASIQILELSLG
jgi:hypothetical protein